MVDGGEEPAEGVTGRPPRRPLPSTAQPRRGQLNADPVSSCRRHGPDVRYSLHGSFGATTDGKEVFRASSDKGQGVGTTAAAVVAPLRSSCVPTLTPQVRTPVSLAISASTLPLVHTAHMLDLASLLLQRRRRGCRSAKSQLLVGRTISEARERGELKARWSAPGGGGWWRSSPPGTPCARAAERIVGTEELGNYPTLPPFTSWYLPQSWSPAARVRCSMHVLGIGYRSPPLCRMRRVSRPRDHNRQQRDLHHVSRPC